jgi:hypothetical protein
MEYWTIYSVIVLKLALQVGTVAHYCVFPTALIYPGSLILARKGRYEYIFFLILTGMLYCYYAMLVMNSLLFYAIISYFILSKLIELGTC